MKDKLKAFYIKHKEFILYFLFGIVTTVASFGAWALVMIPGGMIWNNESGEPPWALSVAGSTVQWVVGVLVAFVTNKKWVFDSAHTGWRVTLRQLAAFSGSRLLTYFIELFLNIGLIELAKILPFEFLSFVIFEMTVGVLLAKVITTVVIVLLNYVFSKLLVFRKKKSKK